MTQLILTDRLTIRPFVADDLRDVIALHNDAAVMHFLNNGGAVPVSEVRAELNTWIEQSSSRNGFGFWAADETATGRFAGWLHLRRDDARGNAAPTSDAELGYRLRRECWGRGLATEGSRALIDHGFTDLGVERVFAHTMAVHRVSRRVLEKAGMRLVRTFRAEWPVRIPGDEYGDVEYALTRQKWCADRHSS